MDQRVRRVVTGHDDKGMAVVRSDHRMDATNVASGDAAFTLVWTSATVPVDNNDDTDGALRPAGATLHGGSVIRIVDMFPGKQSPMHRSNSLDYGIVLTGELELQLEDGSVTRLGAGDIVVQRGTNHLWRNPSETQTCRIAFVLIEANPVRVDGKDLPEIHPA